MDALTLLLMMSIESTPSGFRCQHVTDGMGDEVNGEPRSSGQAVKTSPQGAACSAARGIRAETALTLMRMDIISQSQTVGVQCTRLKSMPLAAWLPLASCLLPSVAESARRLRASFGQIQIAT